MKSLNKPCFICGGHNYDGIIVNGERICTECEERIVNTTIMDSNYDIYKDDIKKILFN